MRKQRTFLIGMALLLTSLSAHAQYGNDTYTVGITGAPCIMLDYVYRPGENSDHSFDMDNNLGTYYPDADGVIRIPLKHGFYQYLVVWNSGKPLNGTFYINNRNVYFEIRYLPPYFGIDSRKTLDKGYQYFNDKKKKDARNLFYIAAEAGDADGMYAYAHMCYNGMGGEERTNITLMFI